LRIGRPGFASPPDRCGGIEQTKFNKGVRGFDLSKFLARKPGDKRPNKGNASKSARRRIERASFLFHPNSADETIPVPTKPFFACRAERTKPPHVNTAKAITTANQLPGGPMGASMRILSFILTGALVMAGSATAGSVDGGLPGIGTFHYGGPVMTASASRAAAVP
jgi:hypothetical protein